VHGFHYVKFIGDGDSSVYTTLLQSVPGWGHAIQKLECASRACKCYRGALEQLVQDNPSYKGKGGLTKNQRGWLVAAARSEIRMRSQEKKQGKALLLLQRVLRNGPLYCFGFHQNCSTAQNKLRMVPSITSNSVPPIPLELSDTEVSASVSYCSQSETSSLSSTSSVSPTSSPMPSTSSTSACCSPAANLAASEISSAGSNDLNFDISNDNDVIGELTFRKIIFIQLTPRKILHNSSYL